MPSLSRESTRAGGTRSGHPIPLLRDESAQLRIGGPICPSERCPDRAAVSPRRVGEGSRPPLLAHGDSASRRTTDCRNSSEALLRQPDGFEGFGAVEVGLL